MQTQKLAKVNLLFIHIYFVFRCCRRRYLFYILVFCSMGFFSSFHQITSEKFVQAMRPFFTIVFWCFSVLSVAVMVIVCAQWAYVCLHNGHVVQIIVYSCVNYSY